MREPEVHFGLGESDHIRKLRLQCDESGDIEPRGQFINGNGQHACDEDVVDGAALSALFQEFEKGLQEPFIRHELFVKMVLVTGQMV